MALSGDIDGKSYLKKIKEESDNDDSKWMANQAKLMGDKGFYNHLTVLSCPKTPIIKGGQNGEL
jgi:hypothetical protein